MSDLLDPEKLKALASVLAPGLIMLTIRAAVQAGAKPDLKDRLLHYAALSSIYYAVAWPVFHWPGGVLLPPALWTLLQYVIAPSVLGVLLAYEINGQWLRRLALQFGLELVHPVPTAWDFAFSRIRQGTFVLVTLNNDSQIGVCSAAHRSLRRAVRNAIFSSNASGRSMFAAPGPSRRPRGVSCSVVRISGTSRSSRRLHEREHDFTALAVGWTSRATGLRSGQGAGRVSAFDEPARQASDGRLGGKAAEEVKLAGANMDRMIDEALTRATRQATTGPCELRRAL